MISGASEPPSLAAPVSDGRLAQATGESSGRLGAQWRYFLQPPVLWGLSGITLVRTRRRCRQPEDLHPRHAEMRRRGVVVVSNGLQVV